MMNINGITFLVEGRTLLSVSVSGEEEQSRFRDDTSGFRFLVADADAEAKAAA